jgi:hypothetical protein
MSAVSVSGPSDDCVAAAMGVVASSRLSLRISNRHATPDRRISAFFLGKPNDTPGKK